MQRAAGHGVTITGFCLFMRHFDMLTIFLLHSLTHRVLAYFIVFLYVTHLPQSLEHDLAFHLIAFKCELKTLLNQIKLWRE